MDATGSAKKRKLSDLKKDEPSSKIKLLTDVDIFSTENKTPKYKQVHRDKVDHARQYPTSHQFNRNSQTNGKADQNKEAFRGKKSCNSRIGGKDEMARNVKQMRAEDHSHGPAGIGQDDGARRPTENSGSPLSEQRRHTHTHSKPDGQHGERKLHSRDKSNRHHHRHDGPTHSHSKKDSHRPETDRPDRHTYSPDKKTNRQFGSDRHSHPQGKKSSHHRDHTHSRDQKAGHDRMTHKKICDHPKDTLRSRQEVGNHSQITKSTHSIDTSEKPGSQSRVHGFEKPGKLKHAVREDHGKVRDIPGKSTGTKRKLSTSEATEKANRSTNDDYIPTYGEHKRAKLSVDTTQSASMRIKKRHGSKSETPLPSHGKHGKASKEGKQRLSVQRHVAAPGRQHGSNPKHQSATLRQEAKAEARFSKSEKDCLKPNAKLPDDIVKFGKDVTKPEKVVSKHNPASGKSKPSSDAVKPTKAVAEPKSFEDCLSYDSTPARFKAVIKKKNVNFGRPESPGLSLIDPSTSSPSYRASPVDHRQAPPKIEPLSLSEAELNVDYRPLPHALPSNSGRVIRKVTMEANSSDVFLTKRSNTRIGMYSGKRKVQVTEMKSLYDLAFDVIKANVEYLEDVGGVPYEILRPAFVHCSASQLFTIENFNPQFVGLSDDLWKSLFERDFRHASHMEAERLKKQAEKRQDKVDAGSSGDGEEEEGGHYRTLYVKNHDEREAKLKKITAKVSSSQVAKAPERKAMELGQAKLPRDVIRKQMRYGTTVATGSNTVRAHNMMTAERQQAKEAVKRQAKAPLLTKALILAKKKLYRK